MWIFDVLVMISLSTMLALMLRRREEADVKGFMRSDGCPIDCGEVLVSTADGERHRYPIRRGLVCDDFYMTLDRIVQFHVYDDGVLVYSVDES